MLVFQDRHGREPNGTNTSAAPVGKAEVLQ